jgi:CO/xanthine dehydrogenase FAD-binding subunit
VDLNTIESIITPATLGEIPPHDPSDAFLAGGTWLFSEPQTHLTRLIDLTRLGWPPLTITPDGLQIAATCTIAQLAGFDPPANWRAGPLFLECCRALLGSFKIWNMATVGGNICMALPAGPMTSLATALEAECLIWTPDGNERRLPITEFVVGPQQNALRPGEILRRIDITLHALNRRFAFRQISLSPLGRSGVLLIGTLGVDGFALTVTASTIRPIRLTFAQIPDAASLTKTLAAEIPDALYFDDVHGRPDWRRHMTGVFAEDIRAELAA